MIHTPSIIVIAEQSWRQLIGSTICEAEVFALAESDEPSEIILTVNPNGARFHIGTTQEDGEYDDRFFYWLSISRASHFKEESLIPVAAHSSTFKFILNADIRSIKLFGPPTADAVFASLLQTTYASLAIATTRWLPNKKKFSQCGSDELAVLDAVALESWVSDQGLELVADIN